MIKAVIFDMDGLLINSEPLQSKSFELLIRSYGKKPIFNDNGLVHLVGTKGNTKKIVKEKHGINEKLEVLTKKRHDIFSKLLKTEEIKVMFGAEKLLKALKQKKIKTAIASNTELSFLEIILKKTKLKEYFPVTISYLNVREPKPAPDIYLETAKRLGNKPEECLVLEDSETGVLSAKGAGLKVIAVPNKFTKDQDFSKADKIVNSLKDISIKLLTNL